MKAIKVEDLPAAAREFLLSLDVSRGDVVIEERGQPLLVVGDARTPDQRRQAKQQLFAVVQGIRGRNPNLNSDDVLRELELVE